MGERISYIEKWKLYRQMIGLEAELPQRIAERLRSEGISETQINQRLADKDFMMRELALFRQQRVRDLPVYEELVGMKATPILPAE